MSISPPALPSGPRSPTPDRVVPGIQFSWGRLISRVSSMETILAPGRMQRPALFSVAVFPLAVPTQDRKSTRLNSSHRTISYAVCCLKKKKHLVGQCDLRVEVMRVIFNGEDYVV